MPAVLYPSPLRNRESAKGKTVYTSLISREPSGLDITEVLHSKGYLTSEGNLLIHLYLPSGIVLLLIKSEAGFRSTPTRCDLVRN